MNISIIICTCNRAVSLKDTLASLAQVRPVPGLQSEIVVVDNGSSDGTAELVAAHPGVRLCAESRRGLSAARNCGMRESKGQVLLFTDDDIRVAPDWMETLSRPILTGEADGVTGAVILPPHLERPWMTRLHRGWLASQELGSGRPRQMVGASMGFARRVLEAVPSFDEELSPGVPETGTADDQLFSYQMQAAGFRIVGVPAARAWHHFEPERLERKQWIKAAGKAGRSEAYLDHHWLHKMIPMARYHYWRAVARYCFWRVLRRRECRASEGISEWELQLLKYMYRLRRYVIECKRPRKYALRGLIKLSVAE